jgi:hypothetical protein
VERLRWINASLPYFPRDVEKKSAPYTKLPEDELVEILTRAIHVNWVIELATVHQKRLDDCTSLEEAVKYLAQIHENTRLKARVNETTSTKKRGGGQEKSGEENGNPGKRRKKRGSGGGGKDKGTNKQCPHCKRFHPNPDECWSLEKNKHKAPPGYHKNKGTNKERSAAITPSESNETLGDTGFTRAQLQGMVEMANTLLKNHSPQVAETEEACAQAERQPRKRKRFEQAHAQQASEEEEANAAASKEDSNLDKDEESSISSEENEFMSYMNTATAYPFHNREPHASKKARANKYTAETVVEIEDRDGNLVPIRALLDTGTSATIILKKFVRKGRAKTHMASKSTKWQTLGGNFTTKRKALVDFKLPELNTHKKVTWAAHMDETSDPDKALYDIIIGMDMLCELGVVIDTEAKVIRWEGNETPLCNRGVLSNQETVNSIHAITQEAPTLQQAEDRQKRILDADYSEVDMEAYLEELEHLSTTEKRQLREVLVKHPTLFQGGLGVLNVKPVHLEVTPGAQPHHARAFPIPQAYESVTKKEIDRLTKLECSSVPMNQNGQRRRLFNLRKRVTSEFLRIFEDSMQLSNVSHFLYQNF